jgi:flagellar basal-body rod modification protein FlgD
MVASISNVTSNTASGLTSSGTSTSGTQTDAAASQDRFLKLLVAQLNNQDPMNPMDNAQMTSQMAQINTVSGIQQLNDTVKSLSTQFASMQVLQGATMVGRNVLLDSNTLSVDSGSATGAIDLAGNADKVSVQILSPSGQTLDTLNLGSMTAGRHDFTWDASAYQGMGNPTFKVTATQGTASITTTSMARDTVASVGTDNGVMSVQLKGRNAIAYSDIKAIL